MKDFQLDETLKIEVLAEYGLHAKDTGSADVQSAMLTERANELERYLHLNPDDKLCRLSLLKVVGQRRKFLTYLKDTDTARYRSLIHKLKLEQ